MKEENMQKRTIFRILPLAALCTSSMAMAADPNLNSYKFSGTLDLGAYRDYDGSNNIGPISRSNVAISGERDLGNDTKANFKLSVRYDPSTGEANDPGDTKKPFFHGEATVGLKNDTLGSIKVGRALDVMANNTWAYDPFYNFDSIASTGWQLWSWNYATDRTSNTSKSTGKPAAEYGRLNNGIFYASPVVNGFQAHISGAFENSSKAAGAGTENNLGLAVTYNAGSVSLMLGNSKNSNGDKETFLGAKYTVGTLEVMGAVDRTSYKGTTVSTNTAKTVGVSYGMGKYRFMANLGQIDDSQSTKMAGVGAEYMMDNKVKIYASAGQKTYKSAKSQQAVGIGINYSF
jgi:predicted porin